MSRKKPAVPATAIAKKTTLSLSIKERIQVAGMIPDTLSYVDHILADDFKKKVWLTQEEIKEAGLKENRDENGNVLSYIWKPGKDKAKEIELTDAEFEFMKRQANRIKQEKRIIPRDLFDLLRRVFEDEKSA